MELKNFPALLENFLEFSSIFWVTDNFFVVQSKFLRREGFRVFLRILGGH